MSTLALITFLSSTSAAAAMIFLGLRANALERPRWRRCAACGRLLERRRRCDCRA